MFRERFRDRVEGGRRLAERLAGYAGRADVSVFGLPRGGVPVAFEVATRLGAPIDVLVVRKLGTPDQPELAMGAIGPGGVRVLNDEVVRELRIDARTIDAIEARERVELTRREQAYRGDRPPADLRGRTAILIDDGLATGSTMRAAVAAARARGPAKIVVAVPVAARATVDEFRQEVDEVVTVLAPEWFSAVGLWYEEFTQTTDDEVRALLARTTVRSEQAPA